MYTNAEVIALFIAFILLTYYIYSVNVCSD